jgi:hypothetical protein
MSKKSVLRSEFAESVLDERFYGEEMSQLVRSSEVWIEDSACVIAEREFGVHNWDLYYSRVINMWELLHIEWKD